MKRDFSLKRKSPYICLCAHQLMRSLRRARVIATYMIGAGFGGCTISLVEKGKTEAFKAAVGAKYRAAVGYDASFYDTSIQDGVTVKKA